MKQKVAAFERDDAGDWMAVLSCGHTQHIRHNPPLVNRPWVLSEAGRRRFVGYELDCLKCDRGQPIDRTPASGE